MGEVIFQGESPFVVLQAQPTIARVSASAVEMTVFASVEGKHPADYQILVRMTAQEARELVGDLTAAAISADQRKR
jgi:hypothetical protein